MLSDEYHTIEAPSEAVIEDKKSTFHALVTPVESEKEADKQLKSWKSKFRGAADVVRVFKTGMEPNIQTDLSSRAKAATGMLETLESEGLTNVCAIVVRVGKTATANPQAYRDAVLNALRLGKKVKRILYETLVLDVPQEDMTMFARLVTDGRGKIIETKAGQPNRVTIKIRRVQREELLLAFRIKTKDRVRLIK